MAPKLRMFPNGETARRTLAEEAPPNALGTTQMTEILYTRGLALVGTLPPEHDLSTVYCRCGQQPDCDAGAGGGAGGPVDRGGKRALRRRSGFE